ncbi:MAG TPA: hypothetical protein PKC69_07355 [Chitinophagaceae bacterium]|nr:hypothetical protein [Chitinophagaceae bacterium]
MKRIILPVFILFTVLLAGCAKDGKDGVDGEQGPPGTANVIYSAWFSTNGAWVESTGANPYYGEFAYYLRPATAITQAIVDNGAVLCYMKGDPLMEGTAANTVFQLPYTVGVGFGFTDLYDFAVTPGNIRYLYKSDDPWEDVADLGTISFRYIIIPGGVAGRGVTPTYQGHTIEELKKMPYEQVAQLFHIPADGSNH